jgi:hypothetical protein
VAYTGRGASASDGNSDGQRMCEGIDEILKSQKPTALVVDLSELEYQFGDWIGSVLLAWISHQ